MHTLRAALDELVADSEPAPSIERVAFSLMMEEPDLPPHAALTAAEEVGANLPLVSSDELLRLAALGYHLEQR